MGKVTERMDSSRLHIAKVKIIDRKNMNRTLTLFLFVYKGQIIVAFQDVKWLANVEYRDISCVLSLSFICRDISFAYFFFHLLLGIIIFAFFTFYSLVETNLLSSAVIIRRDKFFAFFSFSFISKDISFTFCENFL